MKKARFAILVLALVILTSGVYADFVQIQNAASCSGGGWCTGTAGSTLSINGCQRIQARYTPSENELTEGFVQFDTSSLPDAFTLNSLTLRIYCQKFVGPNPNEWPTTTATSLNIDSINPYIPATGACQWTVLKPKVGTLVCSSEGYKDIVLDKNNAVINPNWVSSFRIWRYPELTSYYFMSATTTGGDSGGYPVYLLVDYTPITDDSQCVSNTIPASISTGSTKSVSVTMKNTGSTTWTDAANYRLGSQDPQDNFRWGIARDRVSANVAPGQQHTFEFGITAPLTPGTYSSRWKMLQENVRWFGQTCGPTAVNVVQNTPPTITITDVNAPAGSGQTYPGFVNLRNSANDNEDLPSELSFTLVSQTNPALVNCQVSADQNYLSCSVPARAPGESCQEGTSDVTVQVRDTGGLTAQDTFTITVDASFPGGISFDSDMDGISNYCDQCPNTIPQCPEINSSNGCPNCDNPDCKPDTACICTSCDDCGNGVWNFCDYQECTVDCAGQNCLFVYSLIWPNRCTDCTGAECGNYTNELSCTGDNCNLGCWWNSTTPKCEESVCGDQYLDPNEDCDYYNLFPVAGDWNNDGIDTIGLYKPIPNDPQNSMNFLLRNSNTPGSPELTINYGVQTYVPVVGDWNGDGTNTIGIYAPLTNTFMLRNTNNAGYPDIQVAYGVAGDIPVVGDWDGDGDDTIGVYRPSTSEFYLKNVNADTEELIVGFIYGTSGDLPVIGDWNKDGVDTVGVRHGISFRLRNSNTAGNPDINVDFGNADDVPLAGDWNGDGIDTIGVYRPSDSTFRLRNSNTPGFADIAPFSFSGRDYIFGDTDTCQELDFDVGTLKCNTQTCAFDTSGCHDIFCGDGYVDSPEQCDFDALGAGVFGAVGSCAEAGFYDGTLSCYHNTCILNTTGCNSFCGNGILETGEECDGSNLRGLTCNDFDTFTGGTLKCDACGFNTTYCARAATCGDGIIDPAEQCDFNILTGQPIYGAGSDQCTDFDTYLGGTLSCIPADYENECLINVSLCTGITPGACGNGAINLGEQCDGTQLGGLACTDFDSFSGGALSCGTDCIVDTSGCTRAATCGDGIIDANEECETVNNILLFGDGSNSCTDLGFDYGALGCNDCGLNISTCRYCTGLADGCCSSNSSGICDPDCTEVADPDCTNCLPTPGNCCNDLGNNGCDTDCPAGKDPDCSTTCLPTADDCCDDTDDTPNQCDPNCDSGVDPDCPPNCTPMPNDCCNETLDYICDTDCVPLIDPDCIGCENTPDNCCLPENDTVCDVNCQQDYDPDCGNCTPIAGDCCNASDDLICDEDCPRGANPVDPNCAPELCDAGKTLCTTGDCCYNCYTCDTGFAPCDYDSACEVGESCTCSDCDSEQDSCLDGLSCDYLAGICVDGPQCPVGTTLCSDGTCQSDCGNNNLGCISAVNGGTSGCDEGESCDCDDCNGQQDSCASGLVCDYGVKTCVDGPPCTAGTTLCYNSTTQLYSCSSDCGSEYPGCINDIQNGICETGEGCDCSDCSLQNDTCIYGASCNPELELCTKPCIAGTTLCEDGKCCSDCGNCGGNLGCNDDDNSVDTIGLYNLLEGKFYLRDSNTAGSSDQTFSFGDVNPNDLTPISGDWDGDGISTVGLYNESSRTFSFSDDSGQAYLSFTYNPDPAADRAYLWPIAGDWDGDGYYTIGIMNILDGVFYLRNSNSEGGADLEISIPLSSAGLPVIGDWNGDGKDKPGVYVYGERKFILRVSESSSLEIVFGSGVPMDEFPVAGDWNGDGIDTIGLYNASVSEFRLKNSNDEGPEDMRFRFGGSIYTVPIVGDFNGPCDPGESCACIDCDLEQDSCVENSACYYPLKTCVEDGCLAQGLNPDNNSCLCNIMGVLEAGLNAGVCDIHNETFCYSTSYAGNSGYAKCCGNNGINDSWVQFESGDNLDDILVEDTCIEGEWYVRQNAGVTTYDVTTTE
ncbi:hypothetical protein HY638_01225 [Candidatus Woesearchaeota archaeon]|nr:hypothetical protein [Candidatus Woesearchaeota archaeon]